jgi:predicted transcriptional regulator
MRRNRSIYDTIYDLLAILSDEGCMGKTRLCTAGGLPLDRCTRLLDLLTEYGLVYVQTGRGRKEVCINTRGYVYIGLYEKIQETLPIRSHFVSS